MNKGGFTGKAQAYAAGRPGYPDSAVEYICSLVPPDAVFADIGAGTGIFTVLIARCGYKIFAVEPNADMREQLTITLEPYPNAEIYCGAGEASTLPDQCVDAIICSQSLGWLDLDGFRAECRRIAKPGAMIASIFNETPGEIHTIRSHRYTSRQASELFFCNPIIREFPNNIQYSLKKWFHRIASNSDFPLPSDPGYDEYIAKANEFFIQNNIGGFIYELLMTVVYVESL